MLSPFRPALIVTAALLAAACAHGDAARSSSADAAPAAEAAAAEERDMTLAYPAARRGDVVDEYHGVRVADPYRWLEDPDSAETRAWIDAENEVTFGFLGRIPSREAIETRLTKLWDFEKFGVPEKHGGRYFYRHNSGLQNQSVLYVLDDLEGEPRMLLDPNTLSEDGTVALTGMYPSDDGKRIAYALSEAGSDWKTWRVRDVATGEDLEDVIRWSKFSGAAWTKDGKGFFYSAYDAPADGEAYTGANYHQKLYYHRVGTPQSKDTLVYQREDQKEWGFYAMVTDDGRWLVIDVSRGTDPRNNVFYKDLSRPDGEVVELLTGFTAMFRFVGNDGPVLWFHTDLDAPRGRIIAVDVRDPAPEKWREIIPQQAETLESVSFVGGRFVAQYLDDAKSLVRLHTPDGALERTLELPGIGSVGGFGGRADDPETFFAFTGFTTPTQVLRLDVATGEQRLFRAPDVDFDPDAYETKQVFFESRDGTRVPMFITHKKGVVLDGTNPTFLYGYGGFNISLTPWFSVSNLVWMELGGVFAVPNLRGGGEYGEEWHLAGTKLNKQNVFDDFVAAAEWLIDQGWTRPEKLAIGGGSNGGLLVGACMTQRPDLFAAALPAVGVLDMLRYHQFTIGWAWASDYGTSADPKEFEALRAYSPLHNVKPGTAYPATLITTADHDDRVVPAHSFKFAAALQHAHAGEAPVLIRIETRAGHGAGKPTAKIIEEVADRWAFLVEVLGMEPSLPPAGAP